MLVVGGCLENKAAKSERVQRLKVSLTQGGSKPCYSCAVLIVAVAILAYAELEC